MTPPTLEAVDLTKRFGAAVALDGASFRYQRFGAGGYVGANGAGKTTTLKLFTGLLRPTSGHALVDGIEVADHPKEALWRMGTVIESPEPPPQMTVREALEYVAGLRGMGAERTSDQIQKYSQDLDLPSPHNRIGRLSKGQRQRVTLAAALIPEPHILLLDEPTAGLDPAERVAVRRVLLDLKKNSLILMSSHLLPEVTDVCDRVIFIDHGRIRREGSIPDLVGELEASQLEVEFATLPSPELLAAVDRLSLRRTTMSPTRYRLAYDGTEETRSRLLAACQARGSLRSFSNVAPSLEDAYLQLFRPGDPTTPGGTKSGS